MRKTITRREVLKAIRTEPLKRGKWVQMDVYKSFVPSSDPKCEVCAVGAVLRHAGLNNEQISEFGDQMVSGPFPCVGDCFDYREFEDAVKQALKEKRYLYALSLKFERHAKRLGKGRRIRNLLANFVKRNFPKSVKVSYNY